MPTPGSIEAKLKQRLDLRGMSTEQFAEVAKLEGIANSSRRHLDRVFRDERTMGGDVAEKLWSLWTEIEALQFWTYAAGLPFRVDLSDGVRVHEWLQTIRKWQQAEQSDAVQNTPTESSAK